MKQEEETISRSRKSLKLVEEMYLERDWTDGRFFDEELESLIQEEKVLTGYPI